MPSLFKPTVATYALPDGKYRTPEGKRVTKDTPDAVRHSRKSEVWYGKYKDQDGRARCVALCADKTASKQMLAKLVVDAKMARLNMTDAFEEHRKRPLSCPDCKGTGRAAAGRPCDCPAGAHLSDYRRYLAAKGNCSEHVALTVARVQATLAGCRFRFIPDLAPGRVAEWLAEQRKAGMSTSTSNGYLVAVKGFARWLVKDRRAGTDPLAHLSRLNAKPDVRRVRRALDLAELQALLAAARASADVYRGLTGADRLMLYATAMATGFRVAELASLLPSAFELAGEPPTVRVQAAYAKNRKEAVQPLPPDLAPALADYLAGRPAGQPVWPGTWHEKAARMLRLDLAAAGIPYRDDAGRVADFHALRHSYITLLARSGINPKLAQELARHSDIRLTMNVYTHAELYDLAAAVDRLPPILPGAGAGKSGAEALAATGTAGAPRPRLDQTNALPCDSVRKHESGERTGPAEVGRLQILPLMPVASGCDGMIAVAMKGERGDLNPQPPDPQSGECAVFMLEKPAKTHFAGPGVSRGVPSNNVNFAIAAAINMHAQL